MEPFKPKRPKTGGRKKGTPNKLTEQIRELAMNLGPEAVASIAALMRSSTNPAIILASARELLDRGFGKPGQYQIVEMVPLHEGWPRKSPEEMKAELTASLGVDGYAALRRKLHADVDGVGEPADRRER
ncbi:hypothetical protein ACFQUU_16445 [Herbaspirillum sp. GCM10030257]|uniref:hypothetical protein n=1 Tax=Herbaspirillum sp. GCM10030257 TaxID=3273393 RepID=UPI00360D3B6D